MSKALASSPATLATVVCGIVALLVSGVRAGGVEPPRPCGHRDLNPTRLPFRHARELVSRCWGGYSFPVRALRAWSGRPMPTAGRPRGADRPGRSARRPTGADRVRRAGTTRR